MAVPAGFEMRMSMINRRGVSRWKHLAFVAGGITLAAAAGCESLSYEGEVGGVPDERVITRFCLDDGDLEQLRADAGLSNEQIMELSGPVVAKTLRDLREPKATNAGDAIAWRHLRRVDENGEIPDGALLRAKAQRDLMVSSLRGAEGLAWEWLGPGNIGGRTRSIVISHENPQVMYAGGVAGGVWKSTNGGAYWQALNDFLPSIAIGCMVMDPTDADRIYLGTGEGIFGATSPRGAGIFVTENGGASFEQLPSTANSFFHFVNRIAISPDDPDVILVGTNTGLYRSDDRGATFTVVLVFNRALDVDFDPTDGQKAIVERDNGVVYSTDGGITWSGATGFPSGAGRIEVAYAPSNPSIVYAGAANYGLYRSVDGGQSFALVSDVSFYGQSNGGGGQGWYDNALWVDPTNPDVVVVGGIDLWRSTSGGVDFTRISQWQFAPSSAHADQHLIIEHPDFDGVTNTTVYFGNDGGVYCTDDIYSVLSLSGWQELNNNYGVTQFYTGGGNRSGKVLGGTQDNGTLIYQGDTETWTAMIGGDGSAVGADNVHLDTFYAATQWGYLFRSLAGGSFPQFIWEGIEDLAQPYNPAQSNFITPYILDPNQNTRLLWGGARLWRTENARAGEVQWSEIKPGAGVNNFISAIAVAPGDSDEIWIGHNNGAVYRTETGTSVSPVWALVDGNLPNRVITSIAIDPDDHDRVYVTMGGFTQQNVWRTTNGGVTWSAIHGSGLGALPSLPVNSIVIDELNEDTLYIGTELGVFSSDNDGLSWTTSNIGPANTIVDQLFWWRDQDNARWLVAATHGRGMYRAATGAPCRADLNSDGQVGSADLSILIGSWGSTNLIYDITGDGEIGSSDLAALIGTWGPCP